MTTGSSAQRFALPPPAAPLLPFGAEGANLGRTVEREARGERAHVLRTSGRNGHCRPGQAHEAAVCGLCAGRAAVDRRAVVGGPGVVRRGPLSRLVGHPQQPHASLRRCVGSRLDLPPAVQQLQRQHRRQPGTARHLRASDPPGDAHRNRWVDFGHRRQVARQASQFAQRRRRQIGRFHLVHRSGLRHRQRQRGRSGDAGDRRLPCLSRRSEDRRSRAGHRRHGSPERSGVFAGREAALRRRYRREPRGERAAAHPPLCSFPGREERQRRRSFRRMQPPDRSTAFASTGTGACGRARAKASTASTPTGR